MEIKYTLQGLLIYIAIGGYLSAFTTTAVGLKRTGRVLFFFGFMMSCFSYGYRWYDAGHVPLQNLFEVFLCLGMIYPFSLFCRRVLRVGGVLGDMFLGAVVLFPAGFIFNSEPQHLPPALQSRLFVPHVTVYVLSYLFMAKGSFQAVMQLAGREYKNEEGLLRPEEGTYRMIRAGFVLLTLGLILGSWWGKLAWGDYWGWDPKEIWSLASWLVYVGYFHFRYMFGKRHARINSIWVIVGMAVIIITLLWVNLSRLFSGLHSYAV